MVKASTKYRIQSDQAAWNAAKAGPTPAPAPPPPPPSFNDRRQVPMDEPKGTITHTKARKLAADWHGGSTSGLASLATSGAVPHGTPDEIAANIPTAPTKRDAAELQQLHNYASKNVGRGPVRGWSELKF